MEIISYGAASKVDKARKYTQEDVLGAGIKSSFPNMDNRIDSLQESVENITEYANEFIVQNTVNIMKSHAKLNALTKTSKYKMNNFVFDDLLDTVFINRSASTGMTHSTSDGSITLAANGKLITLAEAVSPMASKVILTVEADVQPTCFIAVRGDEWIPVQVDKLFTLSEAQKKDATSIKIKMESTPGCKIQNYSLSWT